jgi:hypothetical protein
MALFPLGILSAAGAGGAEGDYELIETQILGSTTPSITFSSLGTYSSTYKHLQVRAVARSTREASGDYLAVRFNGDTTSSYRTHYLYGDGSSVSSVASGSATLLQVVRVAANTASASAFGAGVIDILDPYSTTKNTTLRAFGGNKDLDEIGITSGGFFKTDAIGSITIGAANGDLVTGSRFSIYGIRG